MNNIRKLHYLQVSLYALNHKSNSTSKLWRIWKPKYEKSNVAKTYTDR